MKIKSVRIIILLISGLLLLLPISSLLSSINQNKQKHSKTTYLVDKKNISKNNNILVNSNINNTLTLINNLNYVSEFMTKTIIYKQRMLKLWIIGGKYSKAAKYKDTKRTKKSQLAYFSSNIKRVNRYSHQAKETIDNSTRSLLNENKLISKIIILIKNHPYNYSYYLNIKGYIIPNMSFFIGGGKSSYFKNINPNINSIYNTQYNVSNTNINLNTISLSSEEAGLNAKSITATGSSIYKATFIKLTFKAKIIIFDQTSNSYKYETPTTKKIIPKPVKDFKKCNLYKQNTIDSNDNNSFSKNSSSHFNSKNILLSRVISSNSVPSYIIRPSYLPSNFVTHLDEVGITRVQYNSVTQFNHNLALYILSITVSSILIYTITTLITYKIATKINKYRVKRRRYNLLNNNQNNDGVGVANREEEIIPEIINPVHIGPVYVDPVHVNPEPTIPASVNHESKISDEQKQNDDAIIKLYKDDLQNGLIEIKADFHVINSLQNKEEINNTYVMLQERVYELQFITQKKYPTYNFDHYSDTVTDDAHTELNRIFFARMQFFSD